MLLLLIACCLQSAHCRDLSCLRKLWVRADLISGCCPQIVLSTNVAETSVTIDDVTYVVDIGRQREMGFDPNRALACLEVRCRLPGRRCCTA
jgi:hypothetical protein